jgi:hypothetical protein
MKIICKICKKEFNISPCRLKKIKCCSKKCSNLLKKETMKGKNNPFYGKKHTPEAIEKNRQGHLGQESWNKGKIGVYSEETLSKMREAKAKQTGERHPCWKGGRRKHNGYIFIYSPNHPYKRKNNVVAEHRLVMEKHLNRFLQPQEVVHHINKDKLDNRIENLKLFSNNHNHVVFHAKNGDITGRPKC